MALSREQLQDVVEAVVTHGSPTMAAKELGIAVSTLRSRYKKARDEGFTPKGSVNETPDQEIKRLRNLVQTQDAALRAERAAKFNGVPKKKKVKPSALGKIRVIIPDTHGCHIDKGAAAALLGDLDNLKVDEIVHLGDALDCSGFLAQHHTMGFVAETNYTFEDDVAGANWFLDEVQGRCPGATFHMLEGNHERRIEKWIVTSTIGDTSAGNMLRGMFSSESVMNTEKRGILYYPEEKFHMGLPSPGTILLGKCHFTHGFSTAKHAAAAHLAKTGGNIVYGHTHRADFASQRTVAAGLIAAWSPGCMCKLQPTWCQTSITDWSHGYAIQLVRPDGGFTHINVPIIDGVSYLSNLLSA
jgi:predicted phosphodiesterase